MRNVIMGSFVGFVLAAAFLAACGGGGTAVPEADTDDLAQQFAQLQADVAAMNDRLDALEGGPQGPQVLELPWTEFCMGDRTGDAVAVHLAECVLASDGSPLTVYANASLPVRGRITRVEIGGRGSITHLQVGVWTRPVPLILVSETPGDLGPDPATYGADLSQPFLYEPSLTLPLHIRVDLGSSWPVLQWARIYYTPDDT